jgi:hypothetical protein
MASFGQLPQLPVISALTIPDPHADQTKRVGMEGAILAERWRAFFTNDCLIGAEYVKHRQYFFPLF